MPKLQIFLTYEHPRVPLCADKGGSTVLQYYKCQMGSDCG